MQKAVAELVAKARELDIDRMSEIVGKKVETISVVQVYHNTVVIEIHLGEWSNDVGGKTFPLLKYLSAQLETELLDLHNKQFSSGCDTCEHGSDNGWEIWCRPMKEQNA